MSKVSSNFLESNEVNAEAVELQRYVAEAVRARADRGKAEAAFQAGRDLGLSTRRVLGILHGEVKRVWADELTAGRAWYRAHLDKAAARYEHQAALAKIAADEWDRKWEDG